MFLALSRPLRPPHLLMLISNPSLLNPLPPCLSCSLCPTGDQHFVDGVAEVLNQRHMIYVGDGAVTATDKDGKEATGTEYRIGDVFAQYTCG